MRKCENRRETTLFALTRKKEIIGNIDYFTCNIKIKIEKYKRFKKRIKVFESMIPKTVKVAESPALGVSIYKYRGNSIVARRYKNFIKEVLENA